MEKAVERPVEQYVERPVDPTRTTDQEAAEFLAAFKKAPKERQQQVIDLLKAEGLLK